MIRYKSTKKSSGVFKQCEDLWKKIVALRAGGKSEYSGMPGQVQHHVKGKSNYRLRFETKNGINLTNAEHARVTFYDADMCDEVIERREGPEIWDFLKLCKRCTKTDLILQKIALEQELKKLING